MPVCDRRTTNPPFGTILARDVLVGILLPVALGCATTGDISRVSSDIARLQQQVDDANLALRDAHSANHTLREEVTARVNDASTTCSRAESLGATTSRSSAELRAEWERFAAAYDGATRKRVEDDAKRVADLRTLSEHDVRSGQDRIGVLLARATETLASLEVLNRNAGTALADIQRARQAAEVQNIITSFQRLEREWNSTTSELRTFTNQVRADVQRSESFGRRATESAEKAVTAALTSQDNSMKLAARLSTELDGLASLSHRVGRLEVRLEPTAGIDFVELERRVHQLSRSIESLRRDLETLKQSRPQ